MVSKREDLDKAIGVLSPVDYENDFIANCPDTKWQVVMITNVTYFVTHTGYPLGRGLLPDFLGRKPCIGGLDKDENSSPITNALCAFRCLTVHFQQQDREVATGIYYQLWVDYVS